MTRMGANLEDRVVSLNRVMHAHRGGVELVHSDDSGSTVVRFAGMCTGCTYRPVCAETIVRPAIESLPGIVNLQIEGTRVNEDNRRDLRAGLSVVPST